jgi:Peptidase family M23
MRTNLYCWLIIGLSTVGPVLAQTPDLAGGGMVERQNGLCISDEMRQQMRWEATANIRRIGQNRRPQGAARIASGVSFDWPLQQAGGFSDPGFYGVSNFVDHDPGPAIQDYTCGTQAYNGHRGTDIELWPFRWFMMDDQQARIVAAEAGMIIYKHDGEFDRNCACTTYNWNAVFVQHADGSVAWYGHMKTGSLTNKAVGQTVVKGEFLGNVGSSGCSTGPHLHFEVYADAAQTQLIDPFAGSCNLLNASTWWASQRTYWTPTLNRLMTHTQPPTFQSANCPADGDVMNTESDFTAGQSAYFASYYYNERQSGLTNYKIRKPDGSVYQQWSRVSNGNYNYGSYWYYTFTLPANGPNGTWQYEASYNGQTVSRSFTVNGALPVNLTAFTARAQGKTIDLQWQTAQEKNNAYFSVERSADARFFVSIGQKLGSGDANEPTNYQFTDEQPLPEANYYRLRQVDRDGTPTLSKIITARLSIDAPVLTVLDNLSPGELRLTVQIPQPAGTLQLRISNIAGQTIRTMPIEGQTFRANIANLTTGVYLVQLIDQERVISTKRIFQE